MKKKKIMVISDHPLSISGVAHQTREFIFALLRTGRYQFSCLGGAIKHENYQPMKTEEWGDDLVIFPVDGYGTPDIVRSLIRIEKPDVLWYMSDPRFYIWLNQIVDEIMPLMPVVWYTIWDNLPAPKYNYPAYISNSALVCISKVTLGIVQEIAPEIPSYYLPHAVNTNTFKKIEDVEAMTEFRKQVLPDEKNPNRMIFAWVNRNARRKQSGTLIYWFGKFLDKVGHDNACLIMHTDPKDPNGQDLIRILHDFGLDKGQVILSREKAPAESMGLLYNLADCTINISDAEGFGLSVVESLASETPVIANMTGGMTEQIIDDDGNHLGVGLEPASKTLVGSQEVPYIFEDRLSEEQFVDALLKMYNMSAEDRAEIGKLGRAHVMKNFNYETFNENWVKLIDKVVEENGSWATRKNYTPWRTLDL